MEDVSVLTLEKAQSKIITYMQLSTQGAGTAFLTLLSIIFAPMRMFQMSKNLPKYAEIA